MQKKIKNFIKVIIPIKIRFKFKIFLRRLNKLLIDALIKMNNLSGIFFLKNYLRLFNSKIELRENDIGSYLLQDKINKTSIYISRQQRIPYYLDGIKTRLKYLANEYFIYLVFIKQGDIILDVGSNIGELGKYLRMYYDKNIEYHAFEPSNQEYRVCILNNHRETDFINNIGIWNKPGKMELYDKNITGDSSLLEIEDYVGVTEIEVDTIDNYVNRHNIKNIKILKIEAEGGEPEVLQGAIKTLPIIEYITADLGYERGIDKNQTLSTVTNFLISNGFEMIDINQLRLTALYRNKFIYNTIEK